MVTLAWYLREVPPNKGCRSIKDHKNYLLGVAVETQFWYSSFNPSFRNWHVSCSIKRASEDEDRVEVDTFVHIFDSCTQD